MTTLTQTFVAGQKLRASQLTALVTGINAAAPTTSVVTSDQTVTNSTTLVNATGLSLAGAINQTWYVELDLIYQATTAGDFKTAWTWPAGSTFPWRLTIFDTSLAFASGSFDNTVSSGTSDPIGGQGAGSTRALIAGTWTLTSTAGTLQFQFAQNVAAGATSAVIKAGTVMRATRIA